MRKSAALLVTLALTACTNVYTVRSADLAEGRRRAIAGEDDVAIPARDEDGDPTYVRVDRLTRIEEGPETSHVEARDRRVGMRIAAFSAIAVGAMATTYALRPMQNSNSDGPYEFDPVTPFFAFLFVRGPLFALGASTLLGGTILLVPAFLGSGPEASEPSPGFSPADQALPPPRR